MGLSGDVRVIVLHRSTLLLTSSLQVDAATPVDGTPEQISKSCSFFPKGQLRYAVSLLETAGDMDVSFNAKLVEMGLVSSTGER